MAAEMGSNPRSLQLLPFWMLTSFRLTTVGHSQVDRNPEGPSAVPNQPPCVTILDEIFMNQFLQFSQKVEIKSNANTREKDQSENAALWQNSRKRNWPWSRNEHNGSRNTLNRIAIVLKFWRDSKQCFFSASTFWFRQISHNWTDHGNLSTFEWWL